MAAALEAAGFEVTDRSGGGFDVYVQLPFAEPPQGPSAIDRMRRFLAEGLLARFDAAAQVVPDLRPGAMVVLVSGHRPRPTDPDDRWARHSILEVLAASIVADCGERQVDAAVVESFLPAGRIAEVVRERGRRGDTLALESYDDWRISMGGVVSPTGEED